MAGNKYLRSDSTTGVPTEQAALQTSAGVGSAGSIIAADSTGRLDSSFMPVGIAAPTATVVTSENLAAGDLVNIYNATGTATARKADASTTGKEAHGFVLSAVTAPASATVYFPGDEDTAVTSLTPGTQFLSDVTPGKTISTPPTTSGHLVQRVGVATSATNLVFMPDPPSYTLA